MNFREIFSPLLICCLLLSSACQDMPAEDEAQEKEVIVPEANYEKLGREISAISQGELMKNVKAALEEGGPVHAIKHCNIHAVPLTDSLAEVFHCKIERISLKNRNPNNYPKGKEEVLLLNHYLESYLDGSTIKDSMVKTENKVFYYRPIVVAMEACLKCHGQLKEDISPETSVALNELYPEDKATNYRLGDFRGSWKISFEK